MNDQKMTEKQLKATELIIARSDEFGKSYFIRRCGGLITALRAEREKSAAETRVIEMLAAMCGGKFKKKECPCFHYDWDESTAPGWCWDKTPACLGKTPKECWIRLAREAALKADNPELEADPK